MRFESYRPSGLPGMVAAIWEQQSPERQRWRILPTGWVELIFRLGPPFALEQARVLRPDSEPIRHFCFLSGLHTRPLDLSFDELHVFGVRLHPVAVRALFAIPSSEVRDEAVGGDLLLGDLARIEDGLRAAPDFPSRARWIERELADRLRNHDTHVAAERMRRLVSILPTEDQAARSGLSRVAGYSRSHTHRLFTEWLGQPVTDVIRLKRFVDATRLLHREDGSLSGIGSRLGYFDQAHFIREFRQFSGMTPGGYRRHRGPTPDQLAL